MDTYVDLMANGSGMGEVASKLLSQGLSVHKMRPFFDVDPKTGNVGAYINVFKGGDPKKIENYTTQPVTNATLRRDEWKQLDDAVMEVSRQRLGGVQDLIDKGLTYNLGNGGMGTTVLEWHDVSDAMEADLTMDGVTRSKGDRPVFQYNYLPIPIIHVDYEINARALSASRNMGNPLDTIGAERAARRILEKMEDMLFTNVTYSYGEKDSRSRNTIYSYVNHPDRVQVTFAAVPGAHWNDSGTTGADIVECVLALKQESMNNLHYGPWMLYIPSAYETAIDKDYDATTPGTTIRERILKIAGISGIKVIDRMPADNILLVQMTSDTVRLVRGIGLTNVEWATEGGMVTKYKVMTIQVPQIRSDYNGKCGIVHLAG